MSVANSGKTLQDERTKDNHESNEANQLRIEASPSPNDQTRSRSVPGRITQFFVSAWASVKRLVCCKKPTKENPSSQDQGELDDTNYLDESANTDYLLVNPLFTKKSSGKKIPLEKMHLNPAYDI